MWSPWHEGRRGSHGASPTGPRTRQGCHDRCLQPAGKITFHFVQDIRCQRPTDTWVSDHFVHEGNRSRERLRTADPFLRSRSERIRESGRIDLHPGPGSTFEGPVE